jgi:hypothetical protein
MQEYKITATGNGATAWLNLDTRGNTRHTYHVAVVFESEGSGVATVEMAIEEDLTNATPICHHVLQNLSKTHLSLIEGPITALRLDVSEYTGRSITLKILQS